MRYSSLFFVLLISNSSWSQQKDTLTTTRLASPVIVISECTQRKPLLTHIDSALNRPKAVPASTPIRLICTKRVSDSPPLFVVDGIMTNDISKIPLAASDVETIEVLKTGKEVAKYGDAGRNGVIIITTRSKEFRESVIKNIIDSCQLKD